MRIPIPIEVIESINSIYQNNWNKGSTDLMIENYSSYVLTLTEGIKNYNVRNKSTGGDMVAQFKYIADSGFVMIFCQGHRGLKWTADINGIYFKDDDKGVNIKLNLIYKNSWYVIVDAGNAEKWYYPPEGPHGWYTGTLSEPPQPTLTDFWKKMLRHEKIVLEHTYPDRSHVKITFGSQGTWQEGDMPDAWGIRSILEITKPTLEITTVDYNSKILNEAWTISFEQQIKDINWTFSSTCRWYATFILNDSHGDWRVYYNTNLRNQLCLARARSVHATTMPTRFRLVVNGKDCGVIPGTFSDNGTFTMQVPQEFRKEYNKVPYIMF